MVFKFEWQMRASELFFGRGGAVLKSFVTDPSPHSCREGGKKKERGRGGRGGRGGEEGVFFE